MKSFCVVLDFLLREKKIMSIRLNSFRRGFQRFYSTKPTPHQQAMMARSLPKRTPIEGVQHIIAVGSGKGIMPLISLI